MVSHSCSASFSSFHCSQYTSFSSSSSSSSPSSPPSSPASSQHRTFPPSSPSSSTLALVPFLWEETPGVLKKKMQTPEAALDAQNFGEVSRCSAHPSDSCVLSSSKRLSRPFSASRSKVRSESVPRLRPPPYLSQPFVHAFVQSEDDVDMLPHHQYYGTSSGGISKVMSSFSFPRRRHHHRIPSLEDDPFWMAMVACTNDHEGQGSRRRFKGDSDKVCSEMRRSDSWFAKRAQGHAIHFQQCMPRQMHTSHSTDSSLTSRHCRRLKSEAAASPKLGGMKPSKFKDATVGIHDRHDCTEKGAHSAHLASKALKALNIAKSELQGRCKVLLQQQSSLVDVSCSTHRTKKPSFASKRMLPDLFGCKSSYPLISPPK